MVEITKEEAKYLREKGIYVVKSCKLKDNGRKRGKSYCEESVRAMRELDRYRSSIVVKEEYFVK